MATAVAVPNPVPPPTTVPFPIAVNDDVTAFVAGVLNGIPECADASETTIEFRVDGTLWFSCNGADASQSGTWERSTEAITLSIFATPAIPTGLTLIISGYTLTSTTIVGTIAGFPLPLDVTQDLGAGTPPNIQFITANVTLAKQS